MDPFPAEYFFQKYFRSQARVGLDASHGPSTAVAI
jgi:hypothetical protein